MSSTNDGDTNKRNDFTDPIQLNNSFNFNSIPVNTNVNNQEPILCLYHQLLHHILVLDMQIENIVYFT